MGPGVVDDGFIGNFLTLEVEGVHDLPHVAVQVNGIAATQSDRHHQVGRVRADARQIQEQLLRLFRRHVLQALGVEALLHQRLGDPPDVLGPIPHLTRPEVLLRGRGQVLGCGEGVVDLPIDLHRGAEGSRQVVHHAVQPLENGILGADDPDDGLEDGGVDLAPTTPIGPHGCLQHRVSFTQPIERTGVEVQVQAPGQSLFHLLDFRLGQGVIALDVHLELWLLPRAA